MRVTLETIDGQRLTFDGDLGFDAGPEIPCFRCGICCKVREPVIARHELPRLAAGLGISLATLRRRYLVADPERRGYYRFRRAEPRCPFLTEEGGLATCTIHPFRPEACRAWGAHLRRPECQEGLRRLGSSGLVTPANLYTDEAERAAFDAALAAWQR